MVGGLMDFSVYLSLFWEVCREGKSLIAPIESQEPPATQQIAVWSRESIKMLWLKQNQVLDLEPAAKMSWLNSL